MSAIQLNKTGQKPQKMVTIDHQRMGWVWERKGR